MPVRVRAGGRLHFGYLNLSLTRQRLYGGLGVALDRPAAAVVAEPADRVVAPDSRLGAIVRRSVERLGVDGVRVGVERSLPRHAGLGSGTQTALAVYAAVARAHGIEPDVRAAAPALDRGGRSGVGVAAFERGGFIVDAGQPTGLFTGGRPPRGRWTVPAVAVRHELPADWRFVVALPDLPPGRSGPAEEASMRAVVEGADPAIADRISAVAVDRLLPAAATGDLATFGAAVAEIGRLNGAWYADVQGGVYRPPVGAVVEAIAGHPGAAGVGQSSWGPGVWAVTAAARAAAVRAAAEQALATAGVGGTTVVARPRDRGAVAEPIDAIPEEQPG